MPLYSFQRYGRTDGGQGFSFAEHPTDEKALEGAARLLAWHEAESVEVYQDDNLVGVVSRPGRVPATVMTALSLRT